MPAFRYAERPNRFVFGSDWPLAPMRGYAEFIRSAIPEEFHDIVFLDNARTCSATGCELDHVHSTVPHDVDCGPK